MKAFASDMLAACEQTEKRESSKPGSSKAQALLVGLSLEEGLRYRASMLKPGSAAQMRQCYHDGSMVLFWPSRASSCVGQGWCSCSSSSCGSYWGCWASAGRSNCRAGLQPLPQLQEVCLCSLAWCKATSPQQQPPSLQDQGPGC